MGEKTNKLVISLIKDEFTNFDQIIDPTTPSIVIDQVGTFYAQNSHANSPGWVKDFFGNLLDGKFKFLTASARGVLLTTVEMSGVKHIFAVTFGQGRHLLNQGVVEERFGLKVVLNTVVSDSLRSIDKATLGSVPKQSREQISRAGAADNFGIDIEQDLLGAVTGTSKDRRLGKSISGRDSLAVSVQVDVMKLSDFLMLCLERYQAQDYKNGFDWIDQIKDVRDRKTVNLLNGLLLARLENRTLEKIWMVPPDIIDWVDVGGFRYLKPKRANLEPDLDINSFLDSLGDGKLELGVLTESMVFAISSKTDQVSESWSAHRCIYAEMDHEGRVFVLHSGKWYEIAQNFTIEVLNAFDKVPGSSLTLPEYNHENEGAYNKALVDLVPGSVCLDCNVIPHGGGHSSIEFCDLWTSDNRLVHVKRYSGSQQLSHLFAQGVVAGELFVQDASFREKLNQKLPDSHKLEDPGIRPEAKKYEIVFAIISKSANSLDIPFFSKVSLRNAQRRLEGYGYAVTIKKIVNSA